MNFYQKILAFVTLALMGLTFATIRVFFDPPYSDIFITECTAIFLGELATGATFIFLCTKKDSMLPYSLALGWISIAYLFFTFIMIIPANSDIQLKYFVLIHAAGLTLAAIGGGIFIMGEHNIKQQENQDANLLLKKKIFYLQMQKITNQIQSVFPNHLLLCNACEKLADDLRFCSFSRPDLDSMDQDIENHLQALQKAVASADESECERQLTHLKQLYLLREEQAKSQH